MTDPGPEPDLLPEPDADQDQDPAADRGADTDDRADEDLVLPELGIDPPRERALLEHYDAHLGARNPVLVCAREPGFHLDVYSFGPTRERPFITLATIGMCFLAMNAPADLGEPYDRVELLMYLEPDWDFGSPIGNVPIAALCATALYPRQHDTWLSFGHTIPPGDRPAVPGSILTATLLASPPEDVHFQHLEFPDGSVCHFLWEVPITDAELHLKLQEGTQALEGWIATAGVRVLDVDRNCLVSVENRAQRRARLKAVRARARQPRKQTIRQVRCELHEHGQRDS